MNINAFAQIGYKFTGANATNVKTGDLKSVISTLNTFTYEFWANRNITTDNPVFSHILVGNIVAGGFGVYQGRMVVSLANDFAVFTQSSALPNNTPNAWHHYAFVFNNGTWSFYFDGISVGTNLPDEEGLPQTPQYSDIGPTSINLGSKPTGLLTNFDGLMDEVRVWKVARTSTQILTARNNELLGTPTGLVAYYKLNELSGQVVADSGPNGLNGVLGTSSAVESIDPVINQPAKVTGYPGSATISATAITAATVTLNGTLHDNGNATTATFDYGTSPTLAGSSSVAATPPSINAGAGTTVITAGLTGLSSSTTYYYRAKGLNSAGTTTGDILNFTTPLLQPTLNVVSSITAPFSTTYSTASASQSFTVSGTNLTAAVLITPPAGGFELSTNNTTFSPTLTIGGSGALATTTVYMRLAANAPVSAGLFGGGVQFSTGTLNTSLITLLSNNIVNKAPLTVTVNNQTKVYGAVLPALSASYSGFVNGENILNLTTIPTMTTTATAASSVAGGPYAITASGGASANYAITYVNGNLTVTPAPLTITATSNTKVYGAAVPGLSASYTGLVNGDTPLSLTTFPTITTTATAASSVAGSPYAITVSGAAAANYSFIYVPGTLSVTPAPLTVTANNTTKTYGAAIPGLSASYTGFVNGDTPLSLTTLPTINTTATAASSVAGSPYAVTPSGAAAANYTISYAPGTLSVTPAPLTITVNNQTKIYGAVLPALTASYTGFVNGDTPLSLTTIPTLTTTANATSSVAGSPYAITASGGAGANYTISYVPGALSVTGAPLIITATNKTKAYGAAVPALTASYAGFVNGDTPSSLTTFPTLTTAATAAASVAGSPYAITASGAAAANYAITYAAGNLSVTPVTLTITANSTTKTYGEAIPALTATYSGFVNGDSEASLTTPAVFTTTATAASSVAGSPYAITASGAVNANYTIAYTAGNLSVTRAPLTITVNNKTKIYGAVLPALTASYTGFVNGDTPAGLTTIPSLTTTATIASTVAGSPYAITASGGAAANYTISYAPGTLSVTGAPLVITATNKTKVYGATVPILTASYSGFVNGDTQASLTTLPTLTTAATAAAAVAGSPYAITASGAVAANYAITYAAGNLSVTPAILSVTANSTIKTYGGTVPALTANYSGFVNGDTQASLTTPAVLTTTATAASSVAGSPYAITASGVVSTNYTIAYTAGNLSVTPAPLTITANNQTKAYSAPLPLLTASYSGFVNGDTEASFTTQPVFSTTATANSSIAGGPYPITVSGAVNTNYLITYVPGSLSVVPAILTITAVNKTKVYGAAVPALTVSYSGFINGDTPASLTTQPILTTTATAASSVAGGPYTITVSGAANSNYTINYVPGSLLVTPAPLNITADNQTKAYGAPLPLLTASYSGFVNGDTQASLTTVPALSTTATAASSVAGSPYAITASGAVSPNYAITYVPGNLLVTPASLSITANNATKTYGAALPTLTASYSGFVNGDTQAGLTTAPALSTTATAASSVAGSPYAITASGAVNPNYTINYADGNLNIGTKAITVTADAKSKTYGDNDPAFTYTLTDALIGTDSFTGALTRTTGENVNTYAINQGTLKLNPNYALTYVSANLAIGTKAITVTADAKNKAYGTADPAFTYTVSSGALIGNDTFTGALTRQPGESANTYAITQGTLALNSNYILSYTGANLVITRKVLTITANNQNKVYGSANPALTVSYSGFLNGDTQSILTAQPIISTTATTGSGVNTYPITISGAATRDYEIVYVPGTLTVNKAPLTVTADNKTRRYGLSNPQFTLSYSGFVNGDNAAALAVQPVATSIASITSTPGNYPITVNGAASANYNFNYVNGTLTVIAVNSTSVSNLTISSGTLSPAFTPETRSYKATVDNLSGDISFTITTDPTATVTINGSAAPNGTPSTGIPLNVGNNTITIVIRAQDGITTNIYTITVYKGQPAATITATNILSPNGDGKNDNWVIQDIQLYPKNTVNIFDRAGRIVYSKQGYNNEWDGTLKGAPLAQGTYFYTVDLGPGLPKIKGFITLLKGN